MKIRLAIAPLAVAAALPAGAANLAKIGDTGAVAVYVDKDSMHRNGPLVRAALEWRWVKATELPDKPGRTYRMERQVQVCNCENRSYAVAEGTQYVDERGIEPVASYRNDESALPYMVAPPRTIRDAVVAYVCAAAAPAKKP